MNVCATLAIISRGLGTADGVLTRLLPAALRYGGDVAQGLSVRTRMTELDVAGCLDSTLDTIAHWIGFAAWGVA